MKLDLVELVVVRLPLVRPFVTVNGTTTARDVLLVHVAGDDGEGWGECSADTTPSYWYETIDTVRSVLPRIVRGERVARNPMAHAAFEMAVLDAELRAAGRSLASHVGATDADVLATATAGFDDHIDEFLDAGYQSIKVKVSPDHPFPPWEVPSDVSVQVDANGSFAGHADLVKAMDDLGLRCIEQPLAADDISGHAALTQQLRTPICLDESVDSVEAIDAIGARRAASMVSVKPARLGGIDAARRAHGRCGELGLLAKVGGLLETGIGRAAALAIAAMPGFPVPADLSASDRYWHEDITEPFVLDAKGRLVVPTGPGLGITVLQDVIARHEVSREALELSP